MHGRADGEPAPLESTCRRTYQSFVAFPDVRMELNPNQKLILRDLETGYATVADLVPVIGIGLRNVNENLRKLHAMGLVRITSWENRRKPVWGLKKNKADAPRPAARSKAEYNAKWRNRHPDQSRACSRAYQRKNRELCVMKSKQWRQQNQDKARAYKKAYRMRTRAQRSSASITQTSTSLSGI
jgi:hypothetical protein